MPSLPPELILYIIQCLIPSKPPVAFQASHPITLTLLSLSLVCRLTAARAVRLLHLHCLYIQSNGRLRRLTATSPQVLADIIKDGAPILDSSTPRCLYLAPFLTDSIDQPLIAQRVHSLFSEYSLGLRRLVIDMPLRSLYPEDDHNQVRPMLREAFSKLSAIEEFCSVRDELFLNTLNPHSELEVWSFWPRLKHLALYNVDVVSSKFLGALRKCECLTHLILTRADGLEESIDAAEFPPLPHLQRLMIVNTEEGHRRSPLFSPQTWRSCFLGHIWAASPHFSQDTVMADSATASRGAMDQLFVRTNVPVPIGQESREIEVCQEWVRDHVIDGSLWEFPGAPV